MLCPLFCASHCIERMAVIAARGSPDCEPRPDGDQGAVGHPIPCGAVGVGVVSGVVLSAGVGV